MTNDNAIKPAGLTPQDLLIALVINLMWGFNLIAVKMAVDLISPMTAAWLRQVLVLIICLPALRPVAGRMRELLILGLLSGAIFYIFINLSLAVSSNISSLAIAGQLGAPFSLILAVIVFKERIHRTRIAGMALSFLGVTLLVFDPAAIDEELGIALTAASCVVWAICSLIQRRLAGVPVLTIYAWIGLVGSATLLPIAWFAEPEAMKTVPQLPLATFGWILFSALGSTVIGQGGMSLLLQRHPVSHVVPLTLLAPVLSVIFAALYFQSTLTPVMIVGGSLVMVGVAIVTIRTAKAKEGVDWR